MDIFGGPRPATKKIEVASFYDFYIFDFQAFIVHF